MMLIFGCEVEEVFRVGFGLYLFISNVEGLERGDESLDWVIVFHGIVLFLSIVPLIFLSFLCSLHVYLYCNKKSTIDLIMENRRSNKIYPGVGRGNKNVYMVEKNNKEEFGIYLSENGRTPNILVK
jgi:hypothetical protein